MRILNIGSLNLDRTYRVEHFVHAKETIQALSYEEFCGGKGLNQSAALAKAGAEVYHAGAVGADGAILLQALKLSGADISLIQTLEGTASGHAVIQLDLTGQNSIMIYGGTNQQLNKAYIEKVLKPFGENDVLLLQNEVSEVGFAMELAKSKGLKIVLNPSPINAQLLAFPLHLVDLFILNEVEGQQLAACAESEPLKIIEALKKRFPETAFVLTLGELGAYYFCKERCFYQEIYPVQAVDTTAAGDTFCGYYLASIAAEASIPEALRRASAASALAVSRKGALPSIPSREDVAAFLSSRENNGGKR